MSEFPRMMPVRQVFPPAAALPIAETIRAGFKRAALNIPAGARIALAAGSRGITHLPEIFGAVITELKALGAQPFIIPAMGSHGGATDEGQRDILAEYGISQEKLGVPVHPSMEVEFLGETEEGLKTYCAVEGLKSDGIILINRIKPHTDFAGQMGSGLMKMMVIGLGKRKGAAAFHLAAMRHGYEKMLRNASRLISQRAPILAGVGIVENHYHQTARLEVIPRDRVEAGENELFKEAARLMPKLPFSDIDLLIIDQIGKNISGSGMDPNVIGRWVHGYYSNFSSMRESPVVRRIFVRDLTPETHGNAIGIGLADVTTTRLAAAIDKRFTYINALTSLTPNCAKIPIHFDTDREVLTHILPTLGLDRCDQARIVRISNTLDLERIEISEACCKELEGRSDLVPFGPLCQMDFEQNGNLASLAQA
jgi:hypothetical protein